MKVRTAHQSQYPNPLGFQAGEVLEVGHSDDEYPGWVWVTTTDGNQGWAPEQLIDMTTRPPRALAHYSATELNTMKGECVTVTEVLNQWAWVTNGQGQSGWVPEKTLVIP